MPQREIGEGLTERGRRRWRRNEPKKKTNGGNGPVVEEEEEAAEAAEAAAEAIDGNALNGPERRRLNRPALAADPD